MFGEEHITFLEWRLDYRRRKNEIREKERAMLMPKIPADAAAQLAAASRNTESLDAVRKEQSQPDAA